ncbi:hypothetical protein AFM11_23905 [Mycolicibacterium wolinskyi]|uniref:Uncharacterized protein n=1 Tax=Mycolicibacterium wolinskyi TaxID=59750 RepID=A0A132PGW7_9MYCO|nr:hypothetical protein [Mycolicibacterium wolinskyi]KWX21585.1 hypothetical protein AFM11_23905 [Mycolicibacterium wolinskyi]
MVDAPRCTNYARRRHIRYGLATAAIGVGIGIGLANGQAVAWAEPDSSGKSSSQSSAESAAGPKKPDHRPRHERSSTATKPRDTDTDTKRGDAASDAAKTSLSQPDSVTKKPRERSRPVKATDPGRIRLAEPTRPLTLNLPAVKDVTKALTEHKLPVKALDAPAVTRATPKPVVKTLPLSAKVTAAATTTTTPPEPEPLSPIAEIAALPGRVVNTVLQALDITSSANGPRSPLNFAPINDALFAAFRDVEDKLGLTKPPDVQPMPPKLTYTGPTTGKTPTVAQFLNASTTAYVLGGTPGGLKPLTVDGKQVSQTNVLTGMSGKAWVTPEGQVIIAYQGTTGGTNLLFNPLIAVSQVITDVQVVFTDTTPQAFTDALAFQQEVEAAAIAQGYRREDIFVTGHSLGGWEAAYVAQQTGLGGIGFESPGLNTTVPGNGANSGFVNVLTYGDTAGYFSTDLPGLQPFMEYVPGGGSKPHYGSIVMIGNPDAATPLINAAALWGTGPIGNAIFLADILGNFLQYHLPGIQAYHLGVTPDPGVVPWLGYASGPVNADYADMTIPELQKAASDAGTLFVP